MALPEPPPFDPESSPTVTATGVPQQTGTLPAGYRLGTYLIESRIASGGMGVVYRAKDDPWRVEREWANVPTVR